MSAILYFTNESLTSSIKLALLGIEVKSIYAVYFFYLLSLMKMKHWCMCDIKLCLLTNRYKKLLVEKYSIFPESLPLILSNDIKLRQTLFNGIGGKLDFILFSSVGFPIVMAIHIYGV